jgi:hypothetical protein
MSDNCVYAVLKAVVALIAALDQCEVLSGFALELRADLVALREELEFTTDTDS